ALIILNLRVSVDDKVTGGKTIVLVPLWPCAAAIDHQMPMAQYQTLPQSIMKRHLLICVRVGAIGSAWLLQSYHQSKYFDAKLHSIKILMPPYFRPTTAPKRRDKRSRSAQWLGPQRRNALGCRRS